MSLAGPLEGPVLWKDPDWVHKRQCLVGTAP